MIAIARFVTPFLMPLPVGMFLVFAGLLAIVLNMQKTAILSLLLSLAVFCVFGYGLTVRSRLYDLERQYPPLSIEQLSEAQQEQIKFVVVLGNTHISDPGVPETGQLSTASLYRLVEGIRLHRELPNSRLVVSGGTSQEDLTANAVIVGRTARQLGVETSKLLVEGRSRATIDEARLLKPLLDDAPFVLVTSAAHIARAMRIFQAQGLEPLPAPTNFILKDRQRFSSSSLAPSAFNLELSEQLVYEQLGSLWSRIAQ